MSDELLERLRNPGRRSFLKGSALAAAAMLASTTLRAQEPQAASKSPDDRSNDKSAGGDNQDGEKKSDKDEPSGQAKEGDGARTFVGADGRPYRVCPQCGANMFKQSRTWTCENCGYSYDE